MFFLWVKTIKIKKINSIFESKILVPVIIDGSEKITVSLKKFTTKTVSDPNIEETEEYLKIRETIIQVNTNKKKRCKGYNLKNLFFINNFILSKFLILSW